MRRCAVYEAPLCAKTTPFREVRTASDQMNWRTRILNRRTTQHSTSAKLLSKRQAIRETIRQTHSADFRLGLGNVIIQPAQLDGPFVHVVNDVSGPRVAVARLA